MAGWRPKNKSLFSPRAVVATNIGPNSVRYTAKKSSYPDNDDIDDYYSSKYDTYPSMASWRDNRKKDKAKVYNHELEAKPRFAWQPTRWSTFSFSSFATDVDDNSNLFVKEPENYLTPTITEIRAKTNFWTDEDMRRIKELARACYLKMIDDKDYISEKYKDKDNCSISEEAWSKKKSIFDNVFEGFVPGNTPLEQALAINYTIRDADAKNTKDNGSGRYYSTYFEFRRENYADPTINNLVEMNHLSKERKIEILNKISLIGDLGAQFKVEKECGEQEVANSDVFRKRVMRDYDQLQKVELYQRLLPNFKAKMYTKNLIVNVPVQTSEKKQKIIILCDYSGSMDCSEKQIWVNALLIDRFRYVVKGEAEVYFSFFVSSPNTLRFTHIKNAEDVERFWRNFSNRPSGSFTDIGRIVKYVSNEITQYKKLHNLDIDLSQEKPEILIINDGQDEVGYKEFPYKVNAISLIDYSQELRKLCVATGGKQVRIDKYNNIIAYSKEEGKHDIYKANK